jgi:penicillin-binding protein 1B
MVGYDKVVDLARRAGLNLEIQPTPAVALGSYEVTPLEIAGAYTVFANRGEVLKPYYVQMIRDEEGRLLYETHPTPTPALDARVAYLIVELMQEVIRSGTGVRVRAMGFGAPAAGKTGTSHDGWFAGFTSELLCVVWVGYDDYRDVKLEGAQSALPIWTEFMKRAHAFREYRRVKPFEPPEGIVTVDIDAASGKLAAPGCGPEIRHEVFIAGTQPVELCNGGVVQVAGWETAPSEPTLWGRAGRAAKDPRAAKAPAKAPEGTAEQPAEKPAQKSFFRRLLDVFR